MENIISLATNPKLYRACHQFYVAGYAQRRYPRPLNKVKVLWRPALREAYQEGVEQYHSEVRLARVLYGATA